MRRTNREQHTAQLVSITLLVDKPTLIQLDAAARVLGVDRRGVLLEGFNLLTHAYSAQYGHDEHSKPSGVS